MNIFYKLSPKKLLSSTRLLLLMLMLGFVKLLQAQVSVTATVGTTGPTTYTTVNAAFVAINAGTHQGAITITVTANTTEPVYAAANQLLASGTGSSSYTSILIQPQGNVTISSSATPTASRGVLEFIGADNVTIDGDDPSTTGVRNLTIQVATTTSAGTAALRFSSSSDTSNGCTNITVKNCNIIGGRSSAVSTTTSFGIFSGLSTAAATITTASGAADNDNMLLENNFITRCYYGIYTYGISGYVHDNLVIRNNVIGTNVMTDNVGFRGILTAFTQATPSANSVLIEGNDVRVGDTLTGFSTNIAGIDLATTNAGAVIRNNNIHDVSQPTTGGYGAYGIFLSNVTANAGILIYNNFIRDITAFHYLSSSTSFTNYGIYSTAALTGLRILHNTIVLNKPNAGAGNSNFSACVYLSSTTANIAEFRNNILVNNQSDNTGQACMNVYLGSTNIFSTGTAINRNNYWVSGVSGFVGRVTTTNYQTLNAFKAVTLKDTNSLNFAPTFVSATDLHLQSGGSSPFESAGDTTWLTVDIDGNTRPGPTGSVNGGGYAPDLGADEADMGLPSIAAMATGTKSNITTSAATLNGSIVNNGGSNIIASGIVIGTSSNPLRGGFGVIDSSTNPVVTSGSFLVNVTGLALGTTYYYRSYAVNAIGTAYGPDSSFTTNASSVLATVLKSSPTNVQAYTATVGGNITSDGGAAVTASGIVYATTPNPALFGIGVVDSTTNPLVSIGTYISGLGGLTHSTKYYYRAYATNSVGTAYSVQDSFTTAPVVSTLPYLQNFDSLGNTGWASAIVGGTFNNWVVGTPAKANISAAFSTPNAWITGLTTSYNDNHNAALVSPQFDFSSLTVNPVLRFKHKFRTESCCDGGILEVSVNGGAWTKVENTLGTGTNFNTLNGTAWYNSGAQGNSWGNLSTAFSTAVNGWITSSIALPGVAGQSNVKFRFRFISDVSAVEEGWVIDNIEVFAPSAPTVLTGTKTNVTTSLANLSGTITDNGGNNVTASGIVISTSPTPVRGGFGVIDSATSPLVLNGNFNLNIANLSPATTYYYRAYAVNGVGTSYGADSTFTTNASAVAPTVLRTAATNVQAYSATVGGNITSDGGSVVTASGIVYSTTPNPALFGTGVVDSTTNPVILTGIFTINPAGLTHSTKYYYRAYATNSVGTAYSVLDSFTTSPVISVLPYSQNFDLPGNTGWSSTALNGRTNAWQLGTPAKTNLNGAFSGTNAWVTRLTGNYLGTEDCAVVSPQMDFSALTATPILRFKHEMDVDADINWDGGVVEISINGGAWTRLDPVAGTAPSYNTANSIAWYNNTSGSGTLGSPKWSVNTATTYPGHVNGWITSSTPLTGAAGQSDVKVRFRFWADGGTDEGWSLDDIEVFAPSAPTVLTGTKTNVTTSNATLAGTITNNGGNAVTASGVVVSTSPNPTRVTVGVVDSATNPLVGNGAFIVNLTGLTASTTYYYRAYAVNPVGTSYGPDSSFTTPASAIAPTVLRVAATNVTTTTATFGGNITSDGGATVTSSGVVYSTSPNPVLFGLGVVDSTTTPLVASGTFSFSTVGLTHSTKYYYRAYATNSVGTAYSVQDSFVTDPIISVLPYTQNFESGRAGWNSMLTSTNTNVNWIIGLATNNNWVLGTPAKVYLSGAKSGTNAWVTKLTGQHDVDHDASVVSPQFNFSGLSSDPIVRFNHKFKCESDWDGMIVEVSINGGYWRRADSTLGTGGNFNTPNSYGWYNNNVTSTGGATVAPYFSTDLGSGSAYSSQTNGWIESAFRIVGAAGQSNVRFRFRFIADGFVTDEGWAIDDIEVVNVTTPTTAASNVNVTPSATSANVTFTAGNGQGRMVVARLSSTLAVAPTNNTLYAASAVYGSTNTTGTGNFIVYMGNGTSVNVTGLTALTGYTFDVYEYNGKYMHNSFAGAISSGTTTTPVKLVSLKASKVNEGVLVSWTTASELNNRGFNVERSIDGKTFEYVGFVKGAGNSSVTNNYTLEDADAFTKAGVNKLYYRLKQMDNDGKFEYSQVVTVVNDNDLSSSIVTYPNPFNDKITVDLQNANAGAVKVEVLDISGRLVTTLEKVVNQGAQTITVDGLSGLTQGVYLVRVTASGVTQISKLIKQ